MKINDNAGEVTKPSNLGQKVDAICGNPPGSFEKFAKEKEVYIEGLEKERQDRIRMSKAANEQLALAA